jgi:hypothetical protein
MCCEIGDCEIAAEEREVLVGHTEVEGAVGEKLGVDLGADFSGEAEEGRG